MDAESSGKRGVWMAGEIGREKARGVSMVWVSDQEGFLSIFFCENFPLLGTVVFA